jgi:hypothetical protein
MLLGGRLVYGGIYFDLLSVIEEEKQKLLATAK